MRFKMQRITAQPTLFLNTLAILPAELMQVVYKHTDHLYQHQKPYDELRRIILAAHEPSFEDTFAAYFKTQVLGPSKPSEFLSGSPMTWRRSNLD